MALRRTIIAFALVVGTGCSSAGQEPADSASSISAAADAARSAGSVSFVSSYTIQLPTTKQRIVVRAGGAIDLAAGRARVDLSIGELRASLGAPAGPADESRFTFDETHTWIRVPRSDVATPWVKVASAAIADAGAHPLSGLGSAHPLAMLEVLRGISSEIDTAGEATIGGRPTREYRGTIDVDRAIALASPAGANGMRDGFRGVAEMSARVWIDDEGRARQAIFSLPAGRTVIRTTWSAYGEPAAVTLPDAARTETLADTESLKTLIAGLLTAR